MLLYNRRMQMETMNLVELGRKLKAQRKQTGLPATEVARRAGISRTYLWKLEAAKTREDGKPNMPSFQLLGWLLTVLQWPVGRQSELFALAGYAMGENSSAVSADERPPETLGTTIDMLLNQINLNDVQREWIKGRVSEALITAMIESRFISYNESDS